MSVQLETLGPCVRRLTVEVPAERVRTAFENQYKQLSRRVAIPGFRKGHVPVDEIRRRFGSDVQQDVIKELINESYPAALAEQKVRPISYPVIEKADVGLDNILKYIARFEVLPAFEATGYKAMDLSGVAEPEVTDHEVEHQLHHFAEEYATLEPVPEGRTIQNGDRVVIDYDGTINGRPFEGGFGEDTAVEVGHGHFLKDFEEGLVGMREGESKKIPVKFPDDYPSEEVRGKDAEFTLTVKEHKLLNKPQLTDDFLKDNTDYESLAALKQSLRERIQGRKRQGHRQELKRRVSESLRAANPLELPESLVLQDTESLMRQMAYEMAMSRIEKEQIQDMLASQRDRMVETARARVHTGLLLQKIGEQEKIEVSDADMEAEFARIAESEGGSAEAVKARYEREKWHDALRDRIFQEKVYDFIIGQGLQRIVTR